MQSNSKEEENIRGVAQLASASGLGPEGPVFESQYPDFKEEAVFCFLLFNFKPAPRKLKATRYSKNNGQFAIMTDNPGRISEKEAASIFAISCNSFEIKDYTIVEQIAESIREEYGDIVEYR